MDTKAYSMGSEIITSFDEDSKTFYTTLDNTQKLTFLRGYFDTNGKLFKTQDGVRAFIRMTDDSLKKEFQTVTKIPYQEVTENIPGLLYVGVNALELLHTLYHNSHCTRFNANFATYREMLYCWGGNAMGCTFKYKKTLPNAIKPVKAHVTDTGYDMSLVEKIKDENGVIWYDTGIAVEPPLGYYFEVVGRSSISKSGYMLANNIGIIDASYRGSIKVALVKVNPNALELILPSRLVQLIPRQFVHLDCVEVNELDDTKRAEGGFGSTSS